MKKVSGIAAMMGVLGLVGADSAWALSAETQMLLDLLKSKGVITQNEADEFTRTLETKTGAAPAREAEGPKSLSAVEPKQRREGVLPDTAEEVLGKVRLGGLVEVNALTARTKNEEGEKSTSSDLLLNTAQLSAKAEINEYVSGSVVLLYEEEPGEGGNEINVDEAFISLKGGEICPGYANFGRIYLPFGLYESHFISDPLPLLLGETNDTGVVAGYANDFLDLNVGVFKGDVQEYDQDDQIDTLVASATLSLGSAQEDGLNATGGVAYLSNLANSEELAELASEDGIADTVGGASVFLRVSYAERYFFEAEYLWALDDFTDGDLEFIDAENRSPRAWNLETAARFIDGLEFALRYGGSDEGGRDFLAESEYGAVGSYQIFTNTSLALEYLFQDFENDTDNSQATMQIAVEF